jgi:hypothetical protein
MMDGNSPEKSSPALSCSKLKLDSLFLQWFSLPDSQKMVSMGVKIWRHTLKMHTAPPYHCLPQVLHLLDDVKAGRPVSSSTARKVHALPGYNAATVRCDEIGSHARGTQYFQPIVCNVQPPLSPRKAGPAPLSPSKPSPTAAQLRGVSRNTPKRAIVRFR